MLRTSAACRRAVSVRLSVRASSSCILSKRVDCGRIFVLFSASGSHTILVFPYQTLWQYSDGDPLMGTSNAGGVGKNRDFRPISGFRIDYW